MEPCLTSNMQSVDVIPIVFSTQFGLCVCLNTHINEYFKILFHINIVIETNVILSLLYVGSILSH